ncbi:hypothetical protein D9615_005637 [Tricholomella constricta]|uniref:WW domain-containing protein n=1 Tax=Tricholomella constricta TaxID=117010 RepID=A0A8H5HEC1_9AGAR|nr:hypothetical protein D9615_005637 [Tricholomella constricta]
MPTMTLPPLLVFLSRALRHVSFKPFLQYFRQFWKIIWRSARKRASYMGTRLSSFVSPRQLPSSCRDLETRHADRSSIVQSNMSLPVAYTPSHHSSISSFPYITSPRDVETCSTEIPLHVISPPESIASEDGLDHHHFERSLSRGGDSATLASVSVNDISQQIFLQPPGVNGSRFSLVLPGAQSLQHDESGVAHPGAFGSTDLSDGISDVIYPLMPTKVPRYKRERKIADKEVEFELDPAQKSFSLGELPCGWAQITHPEGQPYFYHAEKRIVTENWLWDPKEMSALNGFIEQFDDFTRSKNLCQPLDTWLVLEFTDEDGTFWCGYYYACASTRSVFWLEKHDISNFLSEVMGDLHPTHIKLYLEYQYWSHWDLFPHVNKPTSQTFEHAMMMITDARTDVQTSKQTTVNHTTDDLKEMADIIECASKQKMLPKSSWCVGRFMSMLVRDQFLNFHGQYGARLNRSQSIHGHPKRPRTWLIKTLSLVLFAAPNVHLNSIEELWVDKLTLKARCAEFFSKLNTQWGEHIVQASILLNANVAFLAIPSNDPSNNRDDVLPTRSAAQIASYLSVVTSFSSMMLALLLVRQHKTKERATVGEFSQYLKKREHPVRGFEVLASLYSLPYALLTWGMGTFLIAFLLMCFQVSSAVTRAVVGLAAAMVCVLIVWCIWMAWEETEFGWRRRWFRVGEGGVAVAVGVGMGRVKRFWETRGEIWAWAPWREARARACQTSRV